MNEVSKNGKNPSRTTSYDNIKMIVTLKWIGNDWKMTFNDHFGVIFVSYIYITYI